MKHFFIQLNYYNLIGISASEWTLVIKKKKLKQINMKN